MSNLSDHLADLYRQFKIERFSDGGDLHKATLLRIQINEATFANLDSIIAALVSTNARNKISVEDEGSIPEGETP